MIENYEITDPTLAEEVELVKAGYPAFDMDAYRGERNDDDEEESLGPAAARE